MSQNSLRDIIKSNRYLYNITLLIKKNLPTLLNHSREYFKVLKINRLNENSRDKILIDLLLRKQLAFLLKEAITHVPYYKETINIKASEIEVTNAYEVLESFPYLQKKVIMNNKDAFLNEKFEKQKLMYMTSGGSTGQGIGVWRTRNEQDIEKAFFDYEWGKLGYHYLKSRIVKFGTEARKRNSEEPWEIRGSSLLISPYHLNNRWMLEIYDKIAAFRPDFFHTYPSCLEALTRFIYDRDLPKIRCKGLLLASEMFTDEQHQLFKKLFNCPFKAHYGLCEHTNLAFMYEDDSGLFYYKLNNVYGYSENLKDQYGNYEIIGTSYWNIAMPLIRYRTQDYGKIRNGIIKNLEGRNQEYLITREGNKIPGFSIKIDEFTWDYIDIYQVVQNEIGKIIIKVVPRQNFNDEIKGQILIKQKERWGGFFDINVEVTDSIPRTEAGKLRLIINNIKS